MLPQASVLAAMLPALTLLPGGVRALVAPRAINHTQEAIDSGVVLSDLNKQAYSNVLARLGNATSAVQNGTAQCTKDNIRVRREWRNMPDEERIRYTDAVACLQQQPALYTDITGSKSMFDDFVALHQSATLYIHLSATFFLWHRYYIWTYESKLESECGYNGTFPYWEWGLDTANLSASPVFDGSATSMGSDGAPTPHEGLALVNAWDNTTTVLPAGTGGGCVVSGPFANQTVHLGPHAMPNYGSITSLNSATPTDDNPRCLRRDLNVYPLQRWASLRNTTELIRDAGDIERFQAVAQGDPRYVGAGQLGVHGAGHYALGGDPSSDVYLSPGDAVFYLHHAQMDRVYWIWQNLDWQNRQAIFGTNTTMNQPASDEVKLDDVVFMGPLGAELSLRDAMDTVNGPFCYVYASD
ncbi:tyrosinase central domain-containing protein [Colletotrichum orchidophilum]|uniref:Tyrosinase central domain-containing protein n=1 Tax=Colletotrichum orchidophilum TaxID=1209926 RepID=A0A1G4BMT9_9PEZI|nr:tyrosinase central domain-containing protein [Colletotrichum orchidophilum]OHF02645.1 tyrosinase central domain-containing protein [Colletotrichum orchidophilum]